MTTLYFVKASDSTLHLLDRKAALAELTISSMNVLTVVAVVNGEPFTLYVEQTGDGFIVMTTKAAQGIESTDLDGAIENLHVLAKMLFDYESSR